jgi:hypothetical protein
MSITMEQTMAKRDDTSARIEEDVLRDARTVASFRGLSLRAYLSDTLRPIVKKDLQEVARKVLDEGKPKKGKE